MFVCLFHARSCQGGPAYWRPPILKSGTIDSEKIENLLAQRIGPNKWRPCEREWAMLMTICAMFQSNFIDLLSINGITRLSNAIGRLE